MFGWETHFRNVGVVMPVSSNMHTKAALYPYHIGRDDCLNADRDEKVLGH